jgi:hypothetical protein
MNVTFSLPETMSSNSLAAFSVPGASSLLHCDEVAA